MLSPLPPEDLKQAELQSYLNPYPLVCAIDGRGLDLTAVDNVALSSPAFLSKTNLLQLRNSLEGNILFGTSDGPDAVPKESIMDQSKFLCSAPKNNVSLSSVVKSSFLYCSSLESVTCIYEV